MSEAVRAMAAMLEIPVARRMAVRKYIVNGIDGYATMYFI
jgi:hypothetical protein